MARVYKPDKTVTVKNLGWLVRHAYKVNVVEFRIIAAKYSSKHDVYLIVKFEDNTIYATRYDNLAICKRWLRRSLTLPNFRECTLKGFDRDQLVGKTLGQ